MLTFAPYDPPKCACGAEAERHVEWREGGEEKRAELCKPCTKKLRMRCRQVDVWTMYGRKCPRRTR